jgi:hypothetical protein
VAVVALVVVVSSRVSRVMVMVMVMGSWGNDGMLLGRYEGVLARGRGGRGEEGKMR